MTTFLLIRHATTADVGRAIAGRAAGVGLDAQGRKQVDRLVARLEGCRFDALYTSPLDRAMETVTPLARRLAMVPEIVEAFTEIDYGEWTGRSLAELDTDPHWRRWNAFRSTTRVPGGELMLEAQARAVGALEEIRRTWPDGRCAVVTHGDIIRGTIAHYAGIPLDLFQRLEFAPASVSALRIGESDVSIRGLNLTDETCW